MEIIKRNNVKIIGDGQPIIFSHGYAVDQTMWLEIIPAFTKTHKIILFDHVGAGNSDLPSYDIAKYNSLQGYTDDLLEICETLNLDHPVFVGHSISAMIGILAAINKPKYFSKLILVSPSACYINKDDYLGGFTQEDVENLLETMNYDYYAWATSMAPAAMGNINNPKLALDLAATFKKTDPEIAKQFAKVTFLSDNREHLGKVKTPTLILQATDDIVAPCSVGKYLNEHISESKMIEMKAEGHYVPISAPEETIQAIKSFI